MIAPHLNIAKSQCHVENGLKRVRVLFGGSYIVDTLRAKLVWEKPYYPTYFFQDSDLSSQFLEPGSSPSLYNVVVGAKKAKDAVQKFPAENATHPELAGLLKINFGAMDAWFEEDEQIFVHPKDPYKRVDVLQSSRHIRVEINGVQIAETTKARLLFETSLPVRYYIPKPDCRMDLLVPSELTTQCPYKGVASYYSVKLPSGETVPDIVWWYRVPLPECVDIKGFASFYNEKVDIFVDGVKI